MVEINIIDLMGRNVNALLLTMEGPGVKTIEWDGKDSGGNNVAPGVYFCSLSASNIAETKKIVLLK